MKLQHRHGPMNLLRRAGYWSTYSLNVVYGAFVGRVANGGSWIESLIVVGDSGSLTPVCVVDCEAHLKGV